MSATDPCSGAIIGLRGYGRLDAQIDTDEEENVQKSLGGEGSTRENLETFGRRNQGEAQSSSGCSQKVDGFFTTCDR
jgi:hypothetical protein